MLHYFPLFPASTVWNCRVFTFSSPIHTSTRGKTMLATYRLTKYSYFDNVAADANDRPALATLTRLGESRTRECPAQWCSGQKPEPPIGILASVQATELL